MKKDHLRDYITEAFRLYARLGCRSYEQVKELISKDTLDVSLIGRDPVLQAIITENTIKHSEPMLLDILAVDRTLEMLELGGKQHIVRAVRDVYFVQPFKPLHKGDITDRVRWVSLSEPVSEKQVYQWLKYARLLCAAVRGLRLDEKEIAAIGKVI